MRNLSRALTMLLALLFSACSGGDSSSFTDTASIYGKLAEGAVLSQLDAEMLVGLSEPTGYAWMAESGVPWNARYTYLSPGWADNWGWGAFDGSYAFNYMTQSKPVCNMMCWSEILWTEMLIIIESSLDMTGGGIHQMMQVFIPEVSTGMLNGSGCGILKQKNGGCSGKSH